MAEPSDISEVVREQVIAAVNRLAGKGYRDESGQYMTNDRDFHRVSQFVKDFKK